MWKSTFQKKKNPARWIASLYVIVGALWILFSDSVVDWLIEDPASITRVQTYKGWFFVLASGLLIYTVVSKAVADLRTARFTIREKEYMRKDFLNRHFQPLFQSDVTGKCIFTNEKWLEFTGYTTPPDKAFAWLDIVHADDKPYCIDKFSYGLIDKSAFSLEFRIMTRDGDYHWVLCSCIPYFDISANFSGVIGYLFDLQDKKILEEQFKENSKRYGYLFANNPHPMLVYDMQDLRILEANKAALLQYGYSEKEFLSMSIVELRPASEIPVLMEQLSGTMPEYHRSSGWLHKRKDGSEFFVEIIAHSLPSRNARKNRLVIIRDITEQMKAFKLAKEGERRFRMIFEHSPYATLLLDEELNVLDMNDSARQVMQVNLQNEELKFSDFWAPDSAEYLKKHIDQLRKGIPVVGETDFVRNHEAFRVEFYGISFMENGLLKLFISFYDVDEKYKMQSALQESERINATLVNNLPGMSYRCLNDEAWTMVFASHGVEGLTGYKPGELLYNNKTTFASLIHKDDRDQLRETVKKGLEKKEKYQVHYRIIHKNKKVKWLWEQAQGVFNDEDELLYIEGFIMDVTSEMEARKEVEFQSYFLGLIIDNIPFPLFYKDVNGVYTGCNKSFCDYLGKSKEEIIGANTIELFGEDQGSDMARKDQELITQGVSQSYETHIVFPDGREMNAVFHKSLLKNIDNTPMGVIGVYFDISRRVEAERVIKQQLEELSRINSELERFSYTVSHDLRSPLVTIKGFMGLLKEDLKDGNHDEVADSIFRIDSATDKMHQLLEDLLELSRVGRIVNPYEEFSMTTVAREAKELLHGMLKEKNCVVHIQDDMPEVFADRSRTRELYQNLLENAIKFSGKQDAPSIDIYMREEDGEKIFCVQDNGIGVPQAYQEKIFGLFNKLDSNSPGTGLGLSLVKHIVSNHNGRVWVESEGDNQGAVFCFTLNTEKNDYKNF